MQLQEKELKHSNSIACLKHKIVHYGEEPQLGLKLNIAIV